jgi:hypothetical protein
VTSQGSLSGSRNTVVIANTACHKAQAVFNPITCGVGHYRRFLRRHSWHDEPLPDGPCGGMLPSRYGLWVGRPGGGRP